jgi:hypothetical protein
MLPLHSEPGAYLDRRGVRSPELIEHMRIVCAPGGCLRGWLTQSRFAKSVHRAVSPRRPVFRPATEWVASAHGREDLPGSRASPCEERP